MQDIYYTVFKITQIYRCVYVCMHLKNIHHYDNGVVYWVFISEDFYIEDIFRPFSPQRNM